MSARVLWVACLAAAVVPVAAAAAPPVAPLVRDGSAQWTAAARARVSAAGASAGQGYEYRLSRDGGASWSDPGAGNAVDVEAEGETRVQFRVVDGAEVSDWAPGPGASEDAGLVRLDRRPPGPPQVTGGVLDPVSAAAVRLTASGASDDGSGVAGYQWRTSTDAGDSWSDAAPGGVADITAEGETLVQFRAVDAAGNVGPWAPEHLPTMPAAAATARIDRTPPPRPEDLTGALFPLALSWSRGPESDVYVLARNGVDVTRTTATGVTDLEAVDLAPPTTPGAPLVGVPAAGRAVVSWPPADDRGTAYRYTVRGFDQAGNASPDSPPATLTARSGVVAYVVRLDGRVVAQTAARSLTLPAIAPTGTHTVTVQARDGGGLAGDESPTLGFVATPGPSPRLTVLVGTTAERPGRPVTVRAIVAGRADSPVRWSFDDGATAQGTAAEHAFRSAGVHTVTAEITGATGSPIRVPRRVVIDDTPPSATLVVSGGRIRVRSGDRLSGVASVQMIAPFPQPLGAAGAVLPDGRHAVHVVVTDRAGNTTDLRRDVVIDGTAPRIWVAAPRGVTADVAEVTVSAGDASGRPLRVSLSGRPLIDPSGAGVTIPTGVPVQVDATDPSGNTARVSVYVARVRSGPARDAALDGVAGDQLRYVRGEPALSGARQRLLVEVQDRLRALGLLPRGLRTATRYTVEVLRCVQVFQRRAGLPANGTVGPATRRALAREAARPVVISSR